ISLVPEQSRNCQSIHMFVHMKSRIARQFKNVAPADSGCGIRVAAQQFDCGWTHPGATWVVELEDDIRDSRRASVVVGVGFEMQHCVGHGADMPVGAVAHRMFPEIPTVKLL